MPSERRANNVANALTRMGVPRQQMAVSEELDTGTAKANTRVAEFLFEQATGQRGEGSGSVAAAIFWMKSRARWKETNATEHSGPDGRPIEVADQSAEIERRRIAARALLD
jgi:hypothetical protein